MQFGAERLPAQRPGDAHYRLVLPTDLARVGDAVEAVVACCDAAGPLTSRDRFRLRTITAEAVANAMRYGNGEQRQRQVIVELRCDPAQIVVTVSDEGRGFDPAAVRDLLTEADCHEATGGRGLFLIRHLAEQVSFNRDGNTIWVTLIRS